uniref:Uncharacterized protein n=1 Tax=Glossina pallidipes TaxID=7398 RepID=A0A1A9ZLH6_GLOPL
MANMLRSVIMSSPDVEAENPGTDTARLVLLGVNDLLELIIEQNKCNQQWYFMTYKEGYTENVKQILFKVMSLLNCID